MTPEITQDELEQAITQLELEQPTWAKAFLLRTRQELRFSDIAARMEVSEDRARFFTARAIEYLSHTVAQNRHPPASNTQTPAGETK
jgi:DNA-directed RNA polymerase specialized sigma24 family protein